MKKKLKKAMKKRLRRLVKRHGMEVATTLVTGFLGALAASKGDAKGEEAASRPEPEPAPPPPPQPIYPAAPSSYPQPEPGYAPPAPS